MKIAADTVVQVEYTLRDDEGEILDQSEAGDALAYLHGHGQIVPGLEKALTGRTPGDEFETTVAPAEGYGARTDDAIVRIPRARFGPEAELEVGLGLAVRTRDGHVLRMRVAAIEGDTVTVDGNHPLAGESLHFRVKVVSVRAATAEELAHGHAHGPGGAHHH